MYTAEEFRQDVIANIKGNSEFSPLVESILQNSKFQFNDTSYFTRVIWNTYERNLVIFCAPEDRIELEKYIGKDYDFIRSDLQRAIEECLLVDARIYSINNLQFTQEGLDYMSITMDIETEQGVLTTTLEVKKWMHFQPI